MTVTEQAYAKINLSLDVTGRRADGYHELVSVMQNISLCDTLTVSREGEDVCLDTGGALSADESNLVCRAANAYFDAAGVRFGAHITLEKHIPMCAGLGGGSADAAATLRALNALDGNRFTKERLAAIGASVGADVPFCVMGGTRLCRGIGERMERVENALRAHAVIAITGEGVSTPQAFAALDAEHDDFSVPAREAEQRLPAILAALRGGELEVLASLLYNRFEPVIERERGSVAALREALLAAGATVARMSGSGPAVFGLFASAEAAERAVHSLLCKGVTALACALI